MNILEDKDEARSSEASHGLNPILLEEIDISGQLLSRRVRFVNAHAEIEGMYAVANLMAEGSYSVLKELARLAIKLCEAGTGGISMIETSADGDEIFRWQAVAGDLEQYEGGTTPRDFSPCGECLKHSRPVLYSYPARFFTYFQSVDTTIVEGLVIPLFAAGTPVGTIWIVSHNEHRHFDAEDVRVMTGLGRFVVAALLCPSTNRSGLVNGEVGREIVWAEFVRRIVCGDTAALEAFIGETTPLVFAKALKLVSFRADAEEITADVYAQVWRIAKCYDPRRGTVLSWLLTITHSRAIDRLRRRMSRQARSEASLLMECSSMTDPEANASHAETRGHVRQALQALPFEQRRAIELAYFEGHSMNEISLLLGHPLGTVKTRVRTGLIGLRRLIATTESPIF